MLITFYISTYIISKLTSCLIAKSMWMKLCIRNLQQTAKNIFELQGKFYVYKIFQNNDIITYI